jgi:protocatechuate 3,4-dioxygenase beta subunit
MVEPARISGVIICIMRQLRLPAALFLCFAALSAAAAINGTVMSGDGLPIANAKVSIFGSEMPEAGGARLLSASPEEVPLATAQTDAKGSFSLASPKEPVVYLAVYVRGYAPTERRVEREEEVGAIVLAKAETVSGSVTAGGKPVAGATVVIHYGGYEYVTRSGEDGKYEAPDTKRANRISVIHPKFAIDSEVFGMTRATNAKLQRTLVAGTELKGKVVGDDGKSPVANAAVALDYWPLATTGEDGSFTIAHAPAKWTTLAARKETLRGQRSFSKDAEQAIRMARGATLSGRIIDAKTKLPVGGAIVSAFMPRMGMAMVEGGGGSATSDAKGAFSFVVAAGSYRMMTSHPAYDANPIDVSATAGQTVAKDVMLTPLARVTGIVVDEGNKGVAAASVTTENAGDALMRMMRFVGGGAEVASGPDGRFAIRFPGEADLRLKAVKKGLPVAKSESMKLGPGERKSGVVLTIPTGVLVTGTVTDGEGKPLSGVAVLSTEAESGRGGGMQRIIMSGLMEADDDAVTTGSDGKYTLRLKEGSYDFTFKREGYATRNSRGQTLIATGHNIIDAKLDPAVEVRGRVVRNGTGVDGVMIIPFMADNQSRTTTGPDGSFTLGGLTPGQLRISLRKDDEFIQEMRSVTAPVSDVVIDLPAGSRVSGRVIEKGTTKPVTQFQAGLSRSRSAGGMVMMAPPQLKSFTSDDGSFTLENVPAGAHDLVASAPGFAGGRLSINVEEGKALSGLEVELDTGTRLTGKVTGPNGSPLSDVTVGLAMGPGSQGARGGMNSRTVTDANGEYTLEALQGGDETVEFSHPKYIATRKPVTLKGKEVHVDAQLEGGLPVTGVVVTEAGVPVADANVYASASGGSRRSVRTNSTGMFEFESLAPARYRFDASKAGSGDGKVEDFDINAGGPLRITLRAGGTIYGHITGLTPDELSNTTVEADGNGGSAEATVDSSGNYKIEGAPLGTVRVDATMMSRSITDRRTTPAQTVQVEAGSSLQVDLEFSTGTTVRGRVTRNGALMKGAVVNFNAKSSRSGPAASGSTDDDGRYSITGLEPGEYNVLVMDMQRLSPYSTTYTVRGSSTFDIDYKANALRGRVVDAGTNAPIADANVQLQPADPSTGFRGIRAVLTDASGTFVFDGVPPGSYSTNATKDGYGNQAMDLMIGDRAPDDLELKLSRNDGVVLKVVDARDGRQLDARATVFDAQGRVVNGGERMFFGGAGGASDVKISLAPGGYTASVTAMGYAVRTISFQSPSTQTVGMTPGGTLTIRSKQSAPARVRLIDASGLPYPRYDARPPSTGLSPSPGTTLMEHLAPGAYTLQLLGDNESVLDTVRVTIVEGQMTTTEI